MKGERNMTDTTTSSTLKNNRDLSRIFESKIFWIVLLLLLFALPLTLSLRKPSIEEPPILGQVTDFELINQDGRKFSSRDVSGSVVLVNFIFTRCPSVCPMLTQSMAQVQRRLKGTAKSIQLISVTVDPDFDTPEVLKNYALNYKANFSTWNFLTGTKEEIRRLVVDNFKTALEVEITDDPTDMAPAFDIAHSEHFVLLDQVGRIRGYKKIEKQEDINALLRDFAIIVNTPPKNVR
jgi:protein SCO1/2